MHITLRTLAGIAVCTATAGVLTAFLRDGASIRLVAPAICIQAVIVTALFWGRIAALIGAILAGVTFALWLYPPYGHLWIHDPGERVMLTLFEFAAMCVVVISPRSASAAPGNSATSWSNPMLWFKARRQPSRVEEHVTHNDQIPPSAR